MKRLLTLLLLMCSVAWGQTPTFSSCGAATDSSGLGGTHNVTAPATITPGDLLIYFVGAEETGNNTAITSGPTGFTLAHSQGCGTANRCVAAWVKKAVGDEDGTSISVTMTGGGTGGDAFVGIICRWTTTGTLASPPTVTDTDETTGTDSPATGTTLSAPGPFQVAISATITNGNPSNMDAFGAVTGGTWVERASVGAESELFVQDAAMEGGCSISGGSEAFTSTPDSWTVIGFCVATELSGGQRARRPIEF